MLVGGDLGFLSRFVVAALLVVAGPVLGFVFRWKWRRAVARREEVDQLLYFASTDAARAELEAAAQYSFDYGGYSYGSVLEGDVPAAVPMPSPVPAYSSSTSVPAAPQLQHQCANCFSPASTRCSRCKAVRYCSGKCQIIHWRLGHKDECQPPSNHNHGSDGEGTNHFKAVKKEENEGCAGGIDPEEKNSPVSIDQSFPEHIHSKSSISRESNTVDVLKGKHLTDDRTTNSDPEFSSYMFSTSTSCESFSSTSFSDSNDSSGIDKAVGVRSLDTETSQTTSDHHRPQFLEQPTVVSSINAVSTSSESPCINLGPYGSTKSNHSSSKASTVDGSSKSSLLVSSVPSSDFWEGIARYSRSKVNAMEDVVAHPDSDVIASKFSDAQLLPPGSSKMARATTVLSTNEPSAEVIDNVDMRRSSSLRPKSRNTMENDMLKTSSSYKESRHSLSAASHAFPVNHLMQNDTLKANSAPKTSLNVSHAPKARQVEHVLAKPPQVYLSSTVNMHDYQGVKPVKIDRAQVNSCVSGLGGDSHSSKVGLKSSILKVVDPFKVSKSSQHNALGSCGETAGRYNNKGLFPYELFVKLFNSNNVELRPFGLTNCGNSCYANAVLQCLAFTPPFTAYFLQGFHAKGCAIRAKKEWCFTCEFESLVLNAKGGNSPLSPSRIISHLENIGSSLGNGREEDAHEFLRYVIETMQSICLKEGGVHAPSTLEEQTSLIGFTFGGFLRSKIECLRCGGKSEKHERMMDLTVEIDGDIATLEGALKQFTHTEVLDGENKYHCTRCKSYEKARKKLKILEAPNVLTIALKRFQSGKYGKLNKMITFPEILNLASYMSGTSDKSPIYRLYGVIVHLDVMNAAFSGHYVCYVKNFQNKWFKVDDSTVKPVELERVLSKGAYMLLYSRCSPRAPRLIRNSTVSHDARAQKPLPCKSSSHRNSLDYSSNGQGCKQCLNSTRTGPWQHQTVMTEDSSSDNSSSLFSEGGSYSTDSSNRDSTEDFVDQLFGGDPGYGWRNSTDSETSSSSSSPFSRHSPLADMDRYASSGYPETRSGISIDSSTDHQPQGFWRGPSSGQNTTAKHCSKSLGASRSSGSKIGSDKAYGNMKCR
ncbi:unnamed protein product [Cuscuta europaea]|uniref:ubiquitinyl hydrolase 1 n=1 Tax=Cuscuta europaea TaxID=41803 RepID=A0A9P1E4U0_CUSEU|nr:unnamed protein product [Cuscuta europaea]